MREREENETMLLIMVFLLVIRMESTSDFTSIWEDPQKEVEDCSTKESERAKKRTECTKRPFDRYAESTDFTVIIDTGSATIAIPCKGCS